MSPLAPARIAVLEDDGALAEQLVATLRAAGLEAASYASGRALLAMLKRDTVDLLVLDWNLPGLSGVEVLGWARAHCEGPLPALFVTSRCDEGDIVDALNAGADDYVVKPIRQGELVARVAALLRRSYPAAAREVETFGRYRFDRSINTVAVDGQPLVLTPKEWELAVLLFRNQDRALSRSYLTGAVWGHDPGVMSRTLDVHVSRIRDKLRLRPERGFKLVPVYSYGYRLERVEAAVGAAA